MNTNSTLVINCHYEHTPDQAAEYLRLTLQFMTRYGIKTHPNNLQLCYEHASGENPALRKDVDNHLTQNIPLSEAVCQELYRRHFVQDDPTLEHLRQELRRMVLEVQGTKPGGGCLMPACHTVIAARSGDHPNSRIGGLAPNTWNRARISSHFPYQRLALHVQQ